MSARWFLLLVAACSGATRAPLAKAGDDKDEGAGLLARASTRLSTGDEIEPTSAPARVAPSDSGGDGYGGSMYGDGFGGATYAGWTVTPWRYGLPNRIPKYTVTAGLTGEIQGVVTWTGAAPGKLMTACGAIDNPTLRLGEGRAVRGAIIYIDKITVGRAMAYYGRPASVGGVLAKHGCTLTPAAQIVAPLPASVAIHGDAARSRVRAGGKDLELQEAGVVQIEVAAGVTKIDGDDGKLGAAWVIALDTPYFAITDDNGRFRIDELAPGTYDVTVWQPPIAKIGADGVWTYGAPIVVHRSIIVDATKPALLSVALSGR